MTTATNLQQIAVSFIDGDVKTYQVRDDGVNSQHVEALTFSDMKTWLPVILKSIGDNRYAIVSGFHRYEAIKQQIVIDANNRYTTDDERNNAIAHSMEHTTIKARIVPENMSIDETQLFAFKENSEHGLPLTVAEKKRYAVLIHLQNPEMAHYKIAQLVHISDKTVTSAIDANEKDIAKRNNEAVSPDEETAEVDAEEHDDFTIEMTKAFKSFANAVRKIDDVSSELESETEAGKWLEMNMRKDGDIEILESVVKLMQDTIKTAKKAKAPKIVKASKIEATEVKPVKTPKTKKPSLVDELAYEASHENA